MKPWCSTVVTFVPFGSEHSLTKYVYFLVIFKSTRSPVSCCSLSVFISQLMQRLRETDVIPQPDILVNSESSFSSTFHSILACPLPVHTQIQVICQLLAGEEPNAAGGRSYSIYYVARTGHCHIYRQSAITNLVSLTRSDKFIGQKRTNDACLMNLASVAAILNFSLVFCSTDFTVTDRKWMVQCLTVIWIMATCSLAGGCNQ